MGDGGSYSSLSLSSPLPNVAVRHRHSYRLCSFLGNGTGACLQHPSTLVCTHLATTAFLFVLSSLSKVLQEAPITVGRICIQRLRHCCLCLLAYTTAIVILEGNGTGASTYQHILCLRSPKKLKLYFGDSVFIATAIVTLALCSQSHDSNYSSFSQFFCIKKLESGIETICIDVK